MRWMFLLGWILFINATAAPVEPFVAASTPLDTTLPRPDDALGFQPGERHIRHHELIDYLQQLAAASDRVAITQTGSTHEGRPLFLLSITAADNHPRLDELRQQHVNGDGPLVVWLGYSIHGNEASGSNAAPLVAWYLAASQEDWVKDLLSDTIILLDPSYNPDGLDRFALWTNGQAGLNPSADMNDWEHTEPWPNGRTNHYWFDLNRDWLPLVHPESRARVAQFQRWRPHVLTDHHEMGSDSSFFFQPGVPERTNPLTPAANQQVTALIGEFHARALDKAGELYFSREIFDDYYYGKGSTYPDVQGSVGILFEQASTRGKVVDTSFGRRDFAASIHNHFRTSLSTLRGADHHRQELFQLRADHRHSAREESGRGAWVISDDGDAARAADFIDVLLRHRIAVYPLHNELSENGQTYQAGHAWVIPQRQDQAALITAIFSRPREFLDNTFYDVSAWTLPLAYNLPYAELKRIPAHGREALSSAPDITSHIAVSDQEAIAYAASWNQLNAPAFLHQLHKDEIKVRIATRTLNIHSASGAVQLEPGALIIAAGIHDKNHRELRQYLSTVQEQWPVQLHTITTGLAISGPDLGSPTVTNSQAIRPVLVVGAGLNPYSAGEVWHLLDQRVGLTPTRVEWYRLPALPLDEYSHLLMIGGDYSQISETIKNRVVEWVKRGGQLVTSQSASAWARQLPWEAAEEDMKKDEAKEDKISKERRNYGDFADDFAQRIIGGAIMRLSLDTSHPLAYGVRRDDLAMMKSNLQVLKPVDNHYATVAAYAEEPVLAGYVSAENAEALAGKAAIIAEVVGRGHWIRFADNPVFRGHWLGSSRLYLNALFFGHLIQSTQLPEIPKE